MTTDDRQIQATVCPYGQAMDPGSDGAGRGERVNGTPVLIARVRVCSIGEALLERAGLRGAR
ncbi:hypothetical protein [Actinoplanes sp. URMC 104]|uniref:hypothetical protein n=1 Tax=Actinoplanes sp. URMC 104 TaxID=3423409 RepID=UPI003F1CBA6C